VARDARDREERRLESTMSDVMQADAPVEDDIRHDDLEYNTLIEPQKAEAWLNLLKESEKAFEDWNTHCDNIEKRYASLSRLCKSGRDREFQMFWANMEVIGPSIYAKPPIPAVTPKWKDRRPVPTAASEVLERCITVSFDMAHIDELMKLLRDDVALIGRGVPWCRYEPKQGAAYGYEKVCYDYKHRRDFLHSVSRNWREVTWVAGASYMTRSEARKRFEPYSGDAYKEADYKVDRDIKEVGGTDDRERAKFWEIWDKANRRVVWVAEGCENILDEDDPHLTFYDFFPCPRPAYGTLQRGSLVPVPDVLQYEDQLDEIDTLTAKIHALSNALEAKGFYPAGGAELSEAIQAAVATNTPGRMLVPISNWAAFGGSKEVIVWLPIDVISATIEKCVQLRQQIIQDIYQIVGLSDIMRGSTDARETLGAQELKTQYGSVRIRDKQEELVRVARDLVCITAEIITENFDPVTIIEMSQTQLPTKRMQEQAAMGLRNQIDQQQKAMAAAQQLMQQQPPPGGAAGGPPTGLPPGAMAGLPPPSGGAPGGPPPGAPPPAPGGGAPDPQALMQQGQKVIEEGKKALKQVLEQATFDQVMKLFRDSKTKSFTLDIETDSTIQVDENTEKQRRAEFTAVLAQLLPQILSLVTVAPQTAEFCGEILKFSVAPYRAGRSLDGAIDQLAELMKLKGDQPQQPDPTTLQTQTALQIEQLKDARERENNKATSALKKQELETRDRLEHEKIRSQERMKALDVRSRSNGADPQAEARAAEQEMGFKREEHQMDMAHENVKIENARRLAEIKASAAERTAQLKQQSEQQRAAQQREAGQIKIQQAAMRPQPAPRPGGIV
jgi:hypothetical protein